MTLTCLVRLHHGAKANVFSDDADEKFVESDNFLRSIYDLYLIRVKRAKLDDATSADANEVSSNIVLKSVSI